MDKQNRQDIYAKIRENKLEDEKFTYMIDTFLKMELATDGSIRIGKTPLSLLLAGADQGCDLYIAPGTIWKCVANYGKRYHAHSLDVNIVKSILSELRNPIMILKGSHKNSLVAVTNNKDNLDRTVITSIDLNVPEKRFLVNKITSAHGRRSFKHYISEQIKSGNLIAYNKNKANELLQSLGLQSPLEESFICYDDSISYTLDNVNYPFQQMCSILV